MGRERRAYRDVLVSPGDAGIAVLATRQHGAVSAAQLRALGLTRAGVHRRVDAGRLHRIHRGVYAVGHPRLTLHGRFWAAALAAGGLVSHRSAAAAWDLLPAPTRIEVTTLGRSASTPAITVHRTRTLTTGDRTTLDGLPLTTVTRTLIDLADVLTPHRLQRVLHRAEHLRLLDTAALTTRLAELPGRRTHALHAALATLTHAQPDITRSELEERFLSLVARSRLPAPECNQRLGPHEVDALWRPQRLIAELDGTATHLTARAFEHDRRRDADLQVAGFRVVRFTWRQVAQEPHQVEQTLRALLNA